MTDNGPIKSRTIQEQSSRPVVRYRNGSWRTLIPRDFKCHNARSGFTPECNSRRWCWGVHGRCLLCSYGICISADDYKRDKEKLLSGCYYDPLASPIQCFLSMHVESAAGAYKAGAVQIPIDDLEDDPSDPMLIVRKLVRDWDYWDGELLNQRAQGLKPGTISKNGFLNAIVVNAWLRMQASSEDLDVEAIETNDSESDVDQVLDNLFRSNAELDDIEAKEEEAVKHPQTIKSKTKKKRQKPAAHKIMPSEDRPPKQGRKRDSVPSDPSERPKKRARTLPKD